MMAKLETKVELVIDKKSFADWKRKLNSIQKAISKAKSEFESLEKMKPLDIKIKDVNQ